MNPRKKLILSLSTLALVSVVSILAIVAVLASGVQNVQSNVSVQYIAQGVSATVSASYTKDGTTTSMESDNDRDNDGYKDTSITFTPGTTFEDSLAPSDVITLENSDNILFEYTFTNNSSTEYIVLTYNLIQTEEPDNMGIAYACSTTQLTKDSVINTSFDIQVIDPSTTMYAYVLLQVDNPDSNASFEGDFIWNLEKLDYSVHGNLPEEHLTLSSDGTYYAVTRKNYLAMPDTLIIPSEYNGIPVRALYLSSYGCIANDKPTLPYNGDFDANDLLTSNVKKIYIPSSVKFINGACDNSSSTVVFEDPNNWRVYTGEVIDTDGDGEVDFCKCYIDNLTADQLPLAVTGYGIFTGYGVTFAQD